MCSEVAFCTYIRRILLQYNMVVPLLFSQNNTKRISFHYLEKHSLIFFKSKNDPVVVKCPTQTFLEFYKTLQRVEVLRKTYYHVHFSSICGLQFLKPVCESWGKSIENERNERYYIMVFSHSVTFLPT